jgi:hypothetical protein
MKRFLRNSLIAAALLAVPLAIAYADSPTDAACSNTAQPCSQTSLLKRLANLFSGGLKILDAGGTNQASVDATGHLAVTGGVAQGSTTAGETAALTACATLSADPTNTTAQTNATRCYPNGDTATQDRNGAAIATSTGSTAAAAGAPADAAYSGSGNSSIVAALKGIYAKLAGTLTVGGTVTSNPAAATSGGATPGHFLSAATNNSTSVKGSAGTLYTLEVVQTTTTLGDLRLYDSAAAPTCSSATGVVKNYAVQSNATSPGFIINFGPAGIALANGIGICLTGAVADNDNTSFVTGVQVNYSFK